MYNEHTLELENHISDEYSAEIFDSPPPTKKEKNNNGYLVTLEGARSIPAVSWRRNGYYLTLNGYWYFFNRARDLKVSVKKLLVEAGFESLVQYNHKLADRSERLTFWVSPDNELITRRDYSHLQYAAKKEGISVKEHLLKNGYFRLKDAKNKLKQD